MKKLSLILIPALMVSIVGLGTAATAASKLTAVAKPILLPDREVAEDCNQSAVTLALSDKSRFVLGNRVNVKSSIEEGPVLTNKALQVPGEIGIRVVTNSPGSSLGQATVPIAVQLCTSELPETDPTYLWVHLQLQANNGTPKASIKVKMPILKRTQTLIATDKFLQACKIESNEPTFGNNIIAKVTAKGVRDYYTEGVAGMQLSFQGTLTRRGLISKNDSIQFVYQGSPSKLLATAKTNSRGEFKVTFVAPRVKYEDSGSVAAIIGPKVMPIDSLNIVLPGSTETMNFDWILAPRATRIGASNWIPIFNEDCNAAYAYYNENRDDNNKNRALLISVALGLLGTANKAQSQERIDNSTSISGSSTVYMTSPFSKKVYTKSSSGSDSTEWDGFGSVGSGSGSSLDSGSGSLGGRCYVRGHYRSGKWVSGYYRSC